MLNPRKITVTRPRITRKIPITHARPIQQIPWQACQAVVVEVKKRYVRELACKCSSLDCAKIRVVSNLNLGQVIERCERSVLNAADFWGVLKIES